MRYTENGVITMLQFLIENIFVELGRHIFQQHALTNQDYIFLQLILNDTHIYDKLGRLLKALSSITDMLLLSNGL